MRILLLDPPWPRLRCACGTDESRRRQARPKGRESLAAHLRTHGGRAETAARAVCDGALRASSPFPQHKEASMRHVYRNRPSGDQYRIVFGYRVLRNGPKAVRIVFAGPIVVLF